MCQLSCFYHKLSNCYTDRLDNNSCREESGKNDTKNNHGRLGGIHETMGSLQKQPCHQSEEIDRCIYLACCQLHDIWCSNMDTHKTSTEQTCGRTYINGRTHAQHHNKDKRINIWVRERERERERGRERGRGRERER